MRFSVVEGPREGLFILGVIPLGWRIGCEPWSLGSVEYGESWVVGELVMLEGCVGEIERRDAGICVLDSFLGIAGRLVFPPFRLVVIGRYQTTGGNISVINFGCNFIPPRIW